LQVAPADDLFSSEVAIAMDHAGDFVVAWTNVSSDFSVPFSIWARPFGRDGVAQGPGFQVNSTTSFNCTTPAVAMNSAGAFAVAWSQFNTSMYIQTAKYHRFDSAGNSLSDDVPVNSPGTDAYYPQIALAIDGATFVTWRSATCTGRSFDPSNQPLAGQFSIDASSLAGYPEYIAEASGTVLVRYQASNGTKLQRFLIDGTRLGGAMPFGGGHFTIDQDGDIAVVNTVRNAIDKTTRLFVQGYNSDESLNGQSAFVGTADVNYPDLSEIPLQLSISVAADGGTKAVSPSS
jgi:hypothetical protein